MKKNKVTRRDVLFLSISMFVIVVVWVSLSVYHAYVTSTISEDLQLQIIPIASTFDTDTIEKLKTREQVVPNFTVTDESTESAEVIPTLSPTPSLPFEEITPTIEPETTLEPETTTTPDEESVIEEPLETP